MLAEEFSDCQTFTPEQQNIVRCFESLSNVLSKSDVGIVGDIYDDNSQVTVAETGRYTGRKAIDEYINVISTKNDPVSYIWNNCNVSRTART